MGAGNLVYLDNSSTTKPDRRVVEAVVKVFEEDFGNPHRFTGWEPGQRASSKRPESVARLIGASAGEIYFTSGGTEANNWAIAGAAKAKGKGARLIATTVEHPSVIAMLDHLHEEGYEVDLIGVDEQGFIDQDEVMDAIDSDTALVSVMLVQNEIGSIQPCREIGRGSLLCPVTPKFHVDAIQGFARLPIDVKDWGVDLMSMSAHKIHGAKGRSALHKKRDQLDLSFSEADRKGLPFGN